MRILLAALCVAVSCSAPAQTTQSDPAKVRGPLQEFHQRLIGLETRLAAIKKHEKTTDFRKDEEIWQGQDAHVETLKKDHYKLRDDLKQYANKVTGQVPALGIVNHLQEANDAFYTWLDAKIALLFAGSGNPSLKTIVTNEPKRFQEYSILRDKAAAEIKKLR